MSFYFRWVGTAKAIELSLPAAKASGDQSQIDAVKQFLAGELREIKDQPGVGWDLSISGHHDGSNRNLKIELNPVNLVEAKT